MKSIAENLKRLRKLARLTQGQLAEKAGVSQQLISQLETNKNDSTKELPAIAVALGVAVYDIDEAYTPDTSGVPTIAVPVIAWISAGAMVHDDIDDEVLKTVRAADLNPHGDWIALKVHGSSMDRISPPDSIIFVNRNEKRLVANGCYVIADENGDATYKRFRSGPMRFEPVSTEEHETLFPDQEPTIVGRVMRSMIDLD